MSEAWVTLATNDEYGLGALVLAASLRDVGTRAQLHCLLTAGVSDALRQEIAQAFDQVTLVDPMDSGDSQSLALMGRPDLGVTFTKLHCWRLTQYSKAVFVDADLVLLGNADELFDKEELSAAPDFGWPDAFNSGLFVFAPSEETFRALASTAASQGSFDGGDQGLLNDFFPGWHRLSVAYNMASSAVYTYAPAYRRYGHQVKVAHFLGPVKPWHYKGSPASHPSGGHQTPHVERWWSLFRSAVEKPWMSAKLPWLGSAGAAGSAQHLAALEAGFVDYKGRDAFENIQAAIAKSLQQ